MRFLLRPQSSLFIVILTVLALVACQAETGQTLAGDNELSGLTSTATPTPSSTPTPTATYPPTATPSPLPTFPPPSTTTPRPTSTLPATATATQTPTETMTPTPMANITATVAALAAIDPVDRTCPDPPPGKPEYDHVYLSARRWSAPEAEPEEHFWLDKPLPGGGRFLYTDWLPYGYDAGGRYLLHNGVDSAEPLGTPVLAAADGTVVVAGDDYSRLFGWRCDWYGHLVVIELDRQWRDQPVYVVYGHVLNLKVRPGEQVVRGQPVAEIGVGGAATLPHLHFEVRVGTNEFASTRNPLLWLEPPSTRGVIAGRLVDPDGRPWQGVMVAAVGRSEGTENYTTWTYLGDPQDLANPDESLAENFVLADLRPGEYELYVALQDEVYTVPVVVKGGELVTAEIITEPLKPTTPTATLEGASAATAEPTAEATSSPS